MNERIVGAAVRILADNCTYSLPPPARHGECIRLANSIYQPDNPYFMVRPDEQGFITSRHRYVDRKEAKRIAVAACQLIERAGDLDDLYSEDVW